MGFTIYWDKDLDIEPTGEQIDKAVFRIFKEVFYKNNRICYSSDDVDENAFINEDLVVFNGIGGMSHETFFIEFNNNSAKDFCKTAMKPYTRDVVKTLLILLEEIPGWLSVRSDGGEIPFCSKKDTLEWIETHV
jgi:hypothetical protein